MQCQRLGVSIVGRRAASGVAGKDGEDDIGRVNVMGDRIACAQAVSKLGYAGVPPDMQSRRPMAPARPTRWSPLSPATMRHQMHVLDRGATVCWTVRQELETVKI